jgi:hypothetical protein
LKLSQNLFTPLK